MSRFTDLLTEALREGGGQLDATGQMLKGAALQPVAGLAGASATIADLLRGKGLDKATQSGTEWIDKVNSFGGGPYTERGAQRLQETGDMVKGATDWVGDKLGHPIDKVGEQSPALAAGLMAAMEVADPSKVVGKAVRGVKTAARAAHVADEVGDAAKLAEKLRKPAERPLVDPAKMSDAQKWVKQVAAEGDVQMSPSEVKTQAMREVAGPRIERLSGVSPNEMTQGAMESVLRPRAAATVKNPQRVSFPGIYDDPRELVSRANVAPEDPAMKQLFGVTRGDLFDISEGGSRKGNFEGTPYRTAAKPQGSAAGDMVTNPRNMQRVSDIMGEALKRKDLAHGMVPWYVMDPAYAHFERLWGKERAPAAYEQFNHLTGMASPGSEVLTELNRGSAANWLQHQGRFEDFQKYGGLAEHRRAGEPDFPDDMRGVMGHAYHKTAQAGPMSKYLQAGEIDMDSAKVPSYIRASGVPETGFQTEYPVGDAHWARLMGLPDTRDFVRGPGGLLTPNAASASVPEMTSITPHFKRTAAQHGLESVPGQALVWGAGSHATGVTSPIGAPKLELLSQRIMDASRRMGVSPEEARDLIFLGKAHAGFADPKLLGAAAGAGGAALLANKLRQREEEGAQ